MQFLSCNSILNYDFKRTNAKKKNYIGKQVKVKMVGIPANSFAASKCQITTC